MFKRLNLGEAKPTTIMLPMDDRSYKHPRGVIENVLVKVDNFLFLIDFVILDMEEDETVPIILGRPFLEMSPKLIYFLSPFFFHFLEFKVQFNVELLNLHPDLYFAGF